jgi:hypothetical protein
MGLVPRKSEKQVAFLNKKSESDKDSFGLVLVLVSAGTGSTDQQRLKTVCKPAITTAGRGGACCEALRRLGEGGARRTAGTADTSRGLAHSFKPLLVCGASSSAGRGKHKPK